VQSTYLFKISTYSKECAISEAVVIKQIGVLQTHVIYSPLSCFKPV